MFIRDDVDSTKKMQLQLSSITSGTTRILTVPDASCILVGNDNIQILTNKTLNDTTSYFQNTTDNTKKLQFSLSNITTGNTRVLTIPDANGTILTGNLTSLTNKDILRYTGTAFVKIY